jgi:hypothetical protein
MGASAIALIAALSPAECRQCGKAWEQEHPGDVTAAQRLRELAFAIERAAFHRKHAELGARDTLERPQTRIGFGSCADGCQVVSRLCTCAESYVCTKCHVTKCTGRGGHD